MEHANNIQIMSNFHLYCISSAVLQVKPYKYLLFDVVAISTSEIKFCCEGANFQNSGTKVRILINLNTQEGPL